MSAKAPNVTCISCGRSVACIRVSEGTVYRPFRWSFDDGGLLGTCPQCEETRAMAAWIKAGLAERGHVTDVTVRHEGEGRFFVMTSSKVPLATLEDVIHELQRLDAWPLDRAVVAGGRHG